MFSSNYLFLVSFNQLNLYLFLSLNPSIKVNTYPVLFSKENAIELIKDYDIVIDCSDNSPTRYLVNDACVLSKKILISGSAILMEGQV